MAVTLTVAELRAALRLADSTEETAEATRLLAYATEAVTQHVATAPDVVHNEAARRISGYLYDMPEAGKGESYANALRNSGAGRILLPYRVHRAGYADAVESAQQAVGSAGNPVTDVDVTGHTLTVTYLDGATETFTIATGTVGVDQTARDSAQMAIEEIADHELNHPTGGGVDQTARDSASAAQTSADANTTAIARRVERDDVSAGVGIAVTPTVGSDTAFTISATGSAGGVSDLPGTWQYHVGGPPANGQVRYHGAVDVGQIDTWTFNAGTGYDADQTALLALTVNDSIEFTQSVSRHQTVTLTSIPTLFNTTVTVRGRADRGLSSQIPANGQVSVMLIPGAIQGLDQTARDAAAEAAADAATAQGEIDTHEASTHNTDTTARTAAATAQSDIDDHELNHPSGGGGGATWHWFASFTISATTAAGTAVNGSYRSGPFGNYADAAAVRAGITSNAIPQLIVYFEEIDRDGADSDVLREVVPTSSGFGENAGALNIFEAFTVGGSPKKFAINIAGATPTLTPDFTFTRTQQETIVVRVGVWA